MDSFLPTRGISDSPPIGTGGGWGSAWTVFISPYIEQGPLYSKFVFTGSSGWGATNNAAAASGATIKTLICPSSPIVGAPRGGNQPGSTANLGLNHYVGIAGATNGNTTAASGIIPGYADSRFYTNGGSAGCCAGGLAGGNGILRPGTPSLTIPGIGDGSSNTIMISEMNDVGKTLNGTRVEWSTGTWHGWMIGWPRTNVPENAANAGDARHFQLATIRYSVNWKTGWPNPPGDCGGTGICDSVGNNIPLNSAHTGGVNAVMGDGSVRFIRDSIALDMLARASIRDDGTVGQLD